MSTDTIRQVSKTCQEARACLEEFNSAVVAAASALKNIVALGTVAVGAVFAAHRVMGLIL